MNSVSTSSGKLEIPELDSKGVRSYKGIPFAAAPIGDLRWKPPQKATSWSGIRPVSTFGSNAPQRVVFPDIDPLVVGVSEDCLYLNVWSAAAAGTTVKQPVLFWIHGGGFAVGSGTEPRYDGSQLAARGIVVVTVNTRLNALGLLAHPELTAEAGSSGNYALLDLIAALQWVKENISEFGGDPAAVTIAGESAGSMFCSMLMASPLAKGLFHRVIGQSGAEFPSPEKRTQTLAEAETYGLGFMKKLGVSTLAEMRALPVEALLDASPGLGFWPVIDGYALPASLPNIFAKGLQSDVALLVGWNKDEGTNFTLAERGQGKYLYRQQVQDLFGPVADAVLQLYPDGSTSQTLASAKQLGGDLVICQGAWLWAEAQRQTGKAEIFRFRFDKAPAVPQSWFPNDAQPGAFHSCEIPYVFNTLSAFDWSITPDDNAVANLTAQYWVNFVKTGNPNSAALPEWPSYREANRPALCIDVVPHVLSDPAGDRHRLLAQHSKQ